MEAELAKNEDLFLNMELIRTQRDEMTEYDVDTVKILSRGLRNTPESYEEVACLIDYHCPAAESSEDISEYLWMIWNAVVDIARSPDATEEIRESLANILTALSKHAKGEANLWVGVKRVWLDLPFFIECLYGAFSDPMEDPETDAKDPKSLQIWKNINAFGARCMGARLSGPYENAMHAMRTAFEDENGINDCRVQVAASWIRFGARILLSWAQENLGSEDVTVDDAGQYIEGGPLYDGPDTMCLRRWGFWLERFEACAKDSSELSDETRKLAMEAAETMKTVEKKVANTL